MSRVLLDTTRNAAIQGMFPFQNESILSLAVESKHSVGAKFVHVQNEFAGDSRRQPVRVKGFSGGRADERAIRTDEPYGNSQFPRDRQRVVVSASCGQH